MKKIRECPKCKRKFENEEELFCNKCGVKIEQRDPKFWVCVEVESTDDSFTSKTSEMMGLKELFAHAKDQGFIK